MGLVVLNSVDIVKQPRSKRSRGMSSSCCWDSAFLSSAWVFGEFTEFKSRVLFLLIKQEVGVAGIRRDKCNWEEMPEPSALSAYKKVDVVNEPVTVSAF